MVKKSKAKIPPSKSLTDNVEYEDIPKAVKKLYYPPSPAVLAQIAASLGFVKGDDHDEGTTSRAIKAAFALYISAAFELENTKKMDFYTYIEKYSGLNFLFALRKEKHKTLDFIPKQASDEVRDYLKSKEWTIKTPRRIKELLLDFCRRMESIHYGFENSQPIYSDSEEFNEMFPPLENEKRQPVHKISKGTLDRIIKERKALKSAGGKKSHKTRKQK